MPDLVAAEVAAEVAAAGVEEVAVVAMDGAHHILLPRETGLRTCLLVQKRAVRLAVPVYQIPILTWHTITPGNQHIIPASTNRLRTADSIVRHLIAPCTRRALMVIQIHFRVPAVFMRIHLQAEVGHSNHKQYSKMYFPCLHLKHKVSDIYYRLKS